MKRNISMFIFKSDNWLKFKEKKHLEYYIICHFIFFHKTKYNWDLGGSLCLTLFVFSFSILLLFAAGCHTNEVENVSNQTKNGCEEKDHIQKEILVPSQFMHWWSSIVQSWMTHHMFKPPNTPIQGPIYLIHKAIPKLLCIFGVRFILVQNCIQSPVQVLHSHFLVRKVDSKSLPLAFNPVGWLITSDRYYNL